MATTLPVSPLTKERSIVGDSQPIDAPTLHPGSVELQLLFVASRWTTRSSIWILTINPPIAILIQTGRAIWIDTFVVFELGRIEGDLVMIAE